MSKFVVEKFAYLKEVGEGLLHRLYYSRYFFSNDRTRPWWLKDQQSQRVIKPLTAKFPDFPDTEKLQGYEVLTTKAKNITDDLEEHYLTLVDTADWHDAALSMLTEISSAVLTMKADENPFVLSLWLDLVVLYARIHHLATLIADRKVVLVVYYKMFYHIRSAGEPNYQHAARWANEFDFPFRKIQDEFKANINDAMGKALQSLMMPYMRTRSINSLRKEGALNVTLKPEEMTKPAMDQSRIDLANASKMYMWIVYGYLCTPGAFALQGSLELAKFAISEAYQTPVFKEITVALYPEYDYLFNNYKSKTLQLTKQKKSIKEAAVQSVTEAPRRHLERRIYVRQELEALYHLFKDKPALLGPKIQILWAALSLAKEEIFWYFRHVDTVPPEKLKKNYKAEDFKDKRISSLLHLVDIIITFVNDHRRIIQTYYLEYMNGADLSSLASLADATFLTAAGPTASQYAQNIISDLQNINLDSWNAGASPVPSFQSLRDNWQRLEAFLSTPGSPATIQKFKALIHKFGTVVHHSRNVDSLDELIEEYSGLRHLWYFKEILYGIPPAPVVAGQQQTNAGVPGLYDAVIVDGPDQPLHAMSFLRLLSIFPQNATQYWPEEKELIGRECVDIAIACLNKLSGRVVTILNTVASHYIQAEYQLADANAALPLLQKRKEWKPPSKDWQPPMEPGSESNYKNRNNLDNLRLYQRNAHQLCTALNEQLDLLIYDQLFVPREYLRERMALTLRSFIRKAVTPQAADGLIMRPSVVELQVRVFVSVFSTVENFVDLDVGDMLREVLLGETHARIMGKLGKIDWFPEGDVDFEGGIGGVFAMWYADFVAKRLAPGVCYSPLRLGFATRPGVPFRAEEYADIVELKSLARLVGPYGVKLMERELLRFVLSNVGTIRETVVANVAALEEILGNFHKEAKCNEAIRKIRDLDAFIAKSIAIGNALVLRRLVKSALNQVAHDEIPYIVSAVDEMFSQYPPNVFMYPDLLPTDTLALDLGLANSLSDQSLKVVLKKATTDADKKLWELLPVLYAVSFITSTYWKEAVFRPYIEGHLNNCHSLVYAINDLITALAAITFSPNTSSVEEIAALQLRFVEISSVLLLRMARAKDTKHGPVDFPSIIIFIDRFVQECPFLTEDMLERTLPYTLLRNMYKQIYEDKLVPGKQAESSQDGGF